MNEFKKCKVVMLDTKDSTVLAFNFKSNELFIPIFNSLNHKECTYKHLYILSDDEIKEGDYVYDGKYNLPNIDHEVYKWSYENWIESPDFEDMKCYKIIASTDETLDLPRPSKSFLQKYCDSDGKIEFVNIECEVDYNKDCKLEKFGSKINIYSKCNQFKKNDLDCTDCKMAFYKLKVAKDNTITIHPLKNLYKREEVVTLLAQILGDSAKENYSQMNLRDLGLVK